ncbi:MAG: molybdate ABC transporter permease subunit [Microcoleus vaginatus WJT46-NPBG5]|jgi:molybdate transport system permease protein|nr:molybdate ABC transporter permease subunit [Microcoleus vaginatus WJT46-NPBG5]
MNVQFSILSSLRLSLQVALLATFFVALFGGLIGYLLARHNIQKKREKQEKRFGFLSSNFLLFVFEALITLPLTLPPTVVGFYLLVLFGRSGFVGRPLYEITGWTLVFTWQGAVVAAAVMALPLMVKTTRAALESVDPIYLQAAQTLGQSEWQVFWRVWLPLAWKGIFAGVVLSFARALGEFGATLMIAGNIPGATQTMPMAIYEAMTAGNERLALILVVILSFISLAVVSLTNYLEQRHAQ